MFLFVSFCFVYMASGVTLLFTCFLWSFELSSFFLLLYLKYKHVLNSSTSNKVQIQNLTSIFKVLVESMSMYNSMP